MDSKESNNDLITSKLLDIIKYSGGIKNTIKYVPDQSKNSSKRIGKADEKPSNKKITIQSLNFDMADNIFKDKKSIDLLASTMQE